MIYLAEVWYELSDGLKRWFNSNITDDYPEEALRIIRHAFKKTGFADTDINIGLEREFIPRLTANEDITITYRLRGYIYDSFQDVMFIDPRPIFEEVIESLIGKGILKYLYWVNIFPIRIAIIENAILNEDGKLTVIDKYYCLPEEVELLKIKMQETTQRLLDKVFSKIKYFGCKENPTPA